MKNKEPILCIDFDGVIHSYISGWKGPRNIPDPPVPGAIRFLDEVSKHFEVNIYSSRSRYWFAKRAMKKWLRLSYETYILKVHPEFIEQDPFNEDISIAEAIAQNFVQSLKFPTRKPAAFLTIDDRCLTFTGNFPAIERLKNFKPWNKQGV